ncbi:hypothetical protein JCM8097_008638 [Rhodosporidiobolus ruineniae]
MHLSTLLPALSALLLAAVASASDVPAAVNVTVGSHASYDLVSRYLETIHSQKPSAFFDFVHALTEYKLRPKTHFAHPAFAAPPPGLDGKRRPSAYANHNPIFTRFAAANESLNALEATLFRKRQFIERGEIMDLRLGVAGGIANRELEGMHDAWVEREAELGAASSKHCQSWIDVAGKRACNFDKFWAAVGADQQGKYGPLRISGPVPQLRSFDHIYQGERNESLPLVVLYATPTDEAFPELFNALVSLARPRFGIPRLQFALRWKPDTGAPVVQGLPDFTVEAQVNSGFEVSQVKDVKDFGARALAYIDGADDKLQALFDIATSLPSIASAVLDTAPRFDLAESKLSEQLSINGVQLEPSRLTHTDLLVQLDAERQLFKEIATAALGFTSEAAKEIVIGADITLEGGRKSAVSLAVPTDDRPLVFVNLPQAFANLTGLFTRGSYIEGATDGSGEVDPPAIATFHLVTDLNSKTGLELVRNALKFLETTNEVRLSFVHNPASDSPAPHRYAFSTLISKLVHGSEIAEVYPDELLAFLDLNASPDSPLKRSLDDRWDSENPLTPFIENGATEEEEKAAEAYWTGVAAFVERAGLKTGNSAVLLNGRLIALDDHKLATGSFAAIHQYELKRRIRPVVAALPELPERIKVDRRAQADVISVSTSVIAWSAIQRDVLDKKELEALPSFSFGNPTTSLYTFTAVLDPLSPFARDALPLLHSLKDFAALSHIKVYLLPPSSSSVTKLDLATYHGRAFPFTLHFDDETGALLRPSVQVARGLPVGATLDVRARLTETGEELAGPGGKGGESVKIEEEGEVKEVVFAKVGAATKEKKAEEHVRDEL